MPTTPLSGVRISWLMWARNSPLAAADASARARAASASAAAARMASAERWAVTSATVPVTRVGPPAASRATARPTLRTHAVAPSGRATRYSTFTVAVRPPVCSAMAARTAGRSSRWTAAMRTAVGHEPGPGGSPRSRPAVAS